MSKRPESALQKIWRFKWWWLPPVTILVVVFVVLVVFANITGDAPFEYVIF